MNGGGMNGVGKMRGVEIGDNCESGVLFRFANLEFVFFLGNLKKWKKCDPNFSFFDWIP